MKRGSRPVLASETDLREAAARHLPPAYRALVAATREPFLQTNQDLSVRRMAVGRIALVGDAAFIPRPHTAANTAKAAGNALALVDALKTEMDIPAALRAYYHRPRLEQRVFLFIDLEGSTALANRAAERGQSEVQVYRFPNSLCTDRGRRINNSEPDWDQTLEGRPRAGYEF